MKAKIVNNEYDLLIGYQNDNTYRTAFNKLTKKVFSLSFEYWYKAGYWDDRYIPYRGPAPNLVKKGYSLSYSKSYSISGIFFCISS